MVGALFVSGWLTVIVNAFSERLLAPSLTEITMLPLVPILLLLGVPVSEPVVVLKLVQFGLLVILKVSVSPSTSFAFGVKLYAEPTNILVIGEPLMVGALFVFGGGLTVMVNASNERLSMPSLTTIMMLLLVPILPLPGVPTSNPESVLKLAQFGLLMILKVSVSPSTSFAFGVKL